MALPVGSGQVSLNDIHTEVGGTSGAACTLGDSDIRTWVETPSGEINMGQFIIPSGVNNAFFWDTVADYTVTTYTSGSSGSGPLIKCGVRLDTPATNSRTAATTGTFTSDSGNAWASSLVTESDFEVSSSKVSGTDLDNLPVNGSVISVNREFSNNAGGTNTVTSVYDITITYQPHRSINGTVRVTFSQLDADPT